MQFRVICFLNICNVKFLWYLICIFEFLYVIIDFLICRLKIYLIKEFEDTKGVIRIRIGRKKDRQHNGQKKKLQKDKQWSTKHTYKTRDRVTRTQLKTGMNSGAPEGWAVPASLNFVFGLLWKLLNVCKVLTWQICLVLRLQCYSLLKLLFLYSYEADITHGLFNK